MDLSMYPPDVRAMMEAQIAAAAQTQQPSGNPLLVGNDALRQQFAGQPNMTPWLDQREAHLLGNDAPPPLVTAIPAQMPATAPNPAPQALPQPQAPQPPAPPPMLPQASAAPPAMQPPPAAPMLPPSSQAQITPFPQQAPVMSQVSPAPRVDAQAHIDTSNTAPTQTFTQAYQPPPLPQFMGGGLIPNLGAYKAAPAMPGYAQPRTGSPFMGHPAAQAPQMPSFDNPFSGPQIAGGAAGFTAGGPSPAAGINGQQPYDQSSLFNQFLMPRITPQY